MGGDRIEYDHPPHSQGLSIQKLAKFVTIYIPIKSFIEDRPINWNSYGLQMDIEFMVPNDREFPGPTHITSGHENT